MVGARNDKTLCAALRISCCTCILHHALWRALFAARTWAYRVMAAWNNGGKTKHQIISGKSRSVSGGWRSKRRIMAAAKIKRIGGGGASKQQHAHRHRISRGSIENNGGIGMAAWHGKISWQRRETGNQLQYQASIKSENNQRRHRDRK